MREGFDVKSKPEKVRGCSGLLEREIERESNQRKSNISDGPVASELTQRPVQLHLVNPNASYCNDAELFISADCVPFSFGDFHRRFLKGRKLIIFCPKLDTTVDMHVDKLAELLRVENIQSVSIVRMEIPGCLSAKKIVDAALKVAGKNISIVDHTISVNGEIS